MANDTTVRISGGRRRRWAAALVATSLVAGLAGVTTTAAAAADPPSLTVTPSTGLVDRQTVQLAATGLQPGSFGILVECPAGAITYGSCLLEGGAPVAADGSLTQSMTVRRVLGDGTDCALVACLVGVEGSDGSALLLAVQAPVAFDPSVPPAPPLTATYTVDPTVIMVGRDGNATVSGTVTCSATGDAVLFVSLYVESVPGRSGYGFPVSCDVVPVPWTVSIEAPLDRYPAGPALVSLQLHEQDAPGGPGPETTLPVTIVRDDPPPPPPPAAGTHYYLALGDSLVTGYAAPPGQGYVDDLLAHWQQQDPSLQLENLGCSSETSSGLITNGVCDYHGRSQLEAAEDFLVQHRGDVSAITIDIGGNDLVFCGQLPVDQTGPCVTEGLATVDANLHTILGRLRAAAGSDVPILGMDYFNPYLNHWLGTDADKQFAHLTTAGLDALNQTLRDVFGELSVPVADVSGAFHVDDYDTMVDSPWGTIPINVDLACRWLDIGCEVGGVGSFGDDANAEGYQVIAAEFLKLLPDLPTRTGPPAAVPPVVAPTTPDAVVPPASAPAAVAAAPGAATPVAAVPTFTG